MSGDERERLVAENGRLRRRNEQLREELRGALDVVEAVGVLYGDGDPPPGPLGDLLNLGRTYKGWKNREDTR